MTAGIYIHWPFCRSKCPYCDFNSHVRDHVDHDTWCAALLAELDYYRQQTGPMPVGSVFFGGGTPSLMEGHVVAALIQGIKERFPVSDDLEVTLEANPTSVEADKFAAFQAGGVNRISLGVQSLRSNALSFLGREHSADEALEAVRLARRIFDRVSFDMIYGRPDQSRAEWASELDQALAEQPDHISVYQLTIEQNTGFYGAWKRGAIVMPEDGHLADLYDDTQTRLATAGLPAYEISNHAKPGQECRHNLVYWQSRPWIGIGPGAHGRLHFDGKVVATAQRKKPEAWLKAVETDGHGSEAHDIVAPDEVAIEAAMMGLRLKTGIDLAYIESLSGLTRERWLDMPRLVRQMDQGLLSMQGDNLAATAMGLPVLNSLLADILL